MMNNHWDIVVVDEVHTTLSIEYRKFYENNNWDRIYCFTATLPETPEYRVYLDDIAPGVESQYTLINAPCQLVLPVPCDHIIFSPPYAAIMKTTNNVVYKYKLKPLIAYLKVLSQLLKKAEVLANQESIIILDKYIRFNLKNNEYIKKEIK